jgi:hypothetical protein
MTGGRSLAINRKSVKIFCFFMVVYTSSCRSLTHEFFTKAAIDGKRQILYFMAGQSNMAGQTPLTDDLKEFKVPNVEIFCVEPEKFHVDREAYRSEAEFPQWKSLRPCGASPNSFGPELTFGAALHAELPDAKIYLIKFAHGGTSLGCEWQPSPPSEAYKRYEPDACSRFMKAMSKPGDSMRSYKRFLTAVNWGRDGLRARNISPELGGMLWFQGEADADGRSDFRFLSESYAENLPHLLRSIRSDLRAPEMPFALGKIKCGYSQAFWDPSVSPLDVVRRSQQALADSEPHVVTFDSMDLSVQADRCHFDAPAMKTLGIRFAKALRAQAPLN